MSRLVLIVDDSPIVRSQLGSQIQAAGFEYVAAIDGQNGCEVFKDNPSVALIISDFNMPTMNGIDMLAKIKSDKNNSELPCFILTSLGQGSKDFFSSAKGVGITGWLSKPLKQESLVKILETYCGKL